MTPISLRRKGSTLGTSFLFLILVFISNGCGNDDNSPTSPGDTAPRLTYPTVARDWTGICTESSGVRWTLAATFTQVSDSLLNVSIDWRMGAPPQNPPMWEVNERYSGKITMGRQITISGISVEFIYGARQWPLLTLTAALSAAADTMSGTYRETAPSPTASNGFFVLVKK